VILVADASFAAKVLLREDGTDVAQQWWEDDEIDWVSPALIGPEVEAALHAHQRLHPRRFDGRARAAASTRWAEMLAMITLHAVDRTLAGVAIALVRAHGPLRGADACYLAVARSLAEQAPRQVMLGSFDGQQRRAAVSASLPLVPPNP
jgi:predicted nucleic acid-binding protein